ncbi:hypothetical protein [Streptomyces sp. RFCAC02]|uniref:hypothetical protein n=1 Tax=Streptomyces sp. RFCAC02 TaxID=2499143 RepID=UPI001021C6F6|nr:hypothetical protein [Streptomyces sp. RFCAC02]
MTDSLALSDRLRLDGYEPARGEAPGEWESQSFDLDVLAQHHTADDAHSYFLLHDTSATWGYPGMPQIAALHLTRDPASMTFCSDFVRLPLPAMAQSWLIARGCPADAIQLGEQVGTSAADDVTRALETRLTSDGDRFALLHSYTEDSEPVRIAALLRAVDGSRPPFRILLETTDLQAGTHTLREAPFATYEAATQWWEKYWEGEVTTLPDPAQTTSLTLRPSEYPPGCSAPPGPSRR